MRKEEQLNGKTIVVAGEASDICIIQPLERRELALLQNELDQINIETDGTEYLFVGMEISDWNGELSPWENEPVFGNKAFSGNAASTLRYIEEQLLPYLQEKYGLRDNTRYLLGGYSLAGLFSLWTSLQTDLFTGIAAASPSVWFKNWDIYASQHTTKAKAVYLSLGDAEAGTNHPLLSRTGTNIEALHQQMRKQLGEERCILEWNKGGHFQFPEIRTGKGFGKLIKIVRKTKL
ncbi:MAG: hypothetical protein J6I79_01675 [Paludibacteraceae bacterium]|nr:hypothetical protein [Paludibacteraceae bacterium]